MEVLPQAADYRAPLPWQATLWYSLFFILPGLLLGVLASLGKELVMAIIMLAWGALGAVLLSRRWSRQRRESMVLLAKALESAPLLLLLHEFERNDLNAEAALDLLEYLQLHRPGWSRSITVVPVAVAAPMSNPD
jgi:hypothetical protein